MKTEEMRVIEIIVSLGINVWAVKLRERVPCRSMEAPDIINNVLVVLTGGFTRLVFKLAKYGNETEIRSFTKIAKSAVRFNIMFVF